MVAERESVVVLMMQFFSSVAADAWLMQVDHPRRLIVFEVHSA